LTAHKWTVASKFSRPTDRKRRKGQESIPRAVF
jgi:hypothetical protein